MFKRIKRLAAALLLLFAVTGTNAIEPVNNSLPVHPEKDAIENFWHWFVKNQQRLRSFESDPDLYLSEFLKEIRKIQSGLAVELEPPVNGVINMTISADGNIELFSLVKQSNQSIT